MELYLIKSGFCLAILFGFYKLFLENESMHIFKRFYLLGALMLSFLIPLVTFKTYVEIPAVTPSAFTNTGAITVTVIENTANYWPSILWGMYALGMVFFSVKFGKNLQQLISKIRKNPKFTRNSIQHVLLKTPVIPHTFLNYVFLNKQKFEANEIPEEVIQHEHVHAKQKHSLDILMVELLQIVFWFNPFLYFIKRSIKLNHEFLADRAVLNRGTDTIAYQKLLLAFSSDATTPTLANSINYSFIKKRFTVMKKQTSTQAIWLRSLLVLPLLVLLVYGFSTKKDIIIPQNNSTNVSKTIQAITIYIDQDSEIYLNKKAIAFNDIPTEVNKFNTHLSVEEKQKYVRADISFEKESDFDLATKIGNKLFHSNIWGSSLSSLSAQRKFNHNPATSEMIGMTVEEAEAHYQKMVSDGKHFKSSENDQNNPWSIEISESELINEKQNLALQEKATQAEIKEYNTLAKKYNAMTRDNVQLITEEIDRMKFIYNKMTPQQTQNGQPFPTVLPAQPPTPPAPKVGQTSSLQSAPPFPTIYTVPQPPPAPNDDPIEYIKELTKSGAMFYMGPHRYNSDEVIEIAKKSKDFKLDVSNYPKVNLPGC